MLKYFLAYIMISILSMGFLDSLSFKNRLLERIGAHFRSSCVSENIVQGRSYNNCYIDIYDCHFSRSAKYVGGNGGVIYVNGGSYSMSISSSSFVCCSCSERGGAIYFSSSSSVLNMVCACNCSAICEHFCFVCAPQNYVDYVSFAFCSPKDFGEFPIQLYQGVQRARQINSSLNNAYIISGLYIACPQSFTCSYCLLSNNSAADNTCLGFAYQSGIMSFSNIINNKCPSHGIVRVEMGGSYQMQYCVFYSNQNTLFCVYSGSLEISHFSLRNNHHFHFSDDCE